MDYLSVHPTWNIHWLDSQYQAWKNDPGSLSEPWASWFQSLEDSPTGATPLPSPRLQAPILQDTEKPIYFKILSAYRQWGHLQARFNPLTLSPTRSPFLSLEALGICEADLACAYHTSSEPYPKTLGHLLEELETIYCGPLGYVFSYIQDPERLEWLQTAIEDKRFAPKLDEHLYRKILNSILKTEILEDALDTKFRGQKRFSLEGLNALIPALIELLELCTENNIQKAFIAATHRGRISLLAQVLGKPLELIFREFLDMPQQAQTETSGDVKYHLGWDNTYRSPTGKALDVHLSPNPSHLEAILPVLQGKVRAWQDQNASKASLAIVLHGEAAFAGQGIVAETLNMSGLAGYTTQGTLHVILNNQIGFTTLANQGRSSRYSGDLAKAIDAPLVLVNSENLAAVFEAFHLAFAYQQAFGRDMLIELYGYRKAGHNEIDEPGFTQPDLYPALSERPRLSRVFQDHMAALDISLDAEALRLQKTYQQALEAAFTQALQSAPAPSRLEVAPVRPHPPLPLPVPPLERTVLENIAKALWEVPPGLNLHPKLAKQLEAKKKAFPDSIDWSLAEALALGSILQEGFSIRLTGQDSERGTFSHRHAIWHDSLTGKTHCPLASLAQEGARVSIHNAPLSEAAALGFEYGYSTVSPRCLTLWEAQFGDFVNGAQVILDQFICTAESKWGTQSRLVLLLPHGHQGQGPDHSSARVERFLQACADNNLQVCSPTTPAQYFHLLRRQMHQSHAKPLVLFMPKNLFRHKACVSSLQDLATGSFKPVLPAAEGPYVENTVSPKAVLLCSGKIYYELLAYGKEAGMSLPILRLEQLYPLDIELLESHLATYAPSTRLLWVQEEPKNMGAWSYIASLLAERGRPLLYIGRPAAASVACGRASQHQIEQTELLSRAYGAAEGLSS